MTAARAAAAKAGAAATPAIVNASFAVRDPDRSGKTRLDLLVAGLVQFFFEEIRLLGHSMPWGAATNADADKIAIRYGG